MNRRSGKGWKCLGISLRPVGELKENDAETQVILATERRNGPAIPPTV
jgi:hypothetical protein